MSFVDSFDDRQPVSQPQFSEVGNPESLLWVVRQVGKVRQTLLRGRLERLG
ncbi:MAG: hypothetical protein KME27_20580 [Lyngbya sp. HA4199-MV5]|nr:hypothetical protein [Lyngbya sp. HA4199-MV5]